MQNERTITIKIDKKLKAELSTLRIEQDITSVSLLITKLLKFALLHKKEIFNDEN